MDCKKFSKFLPFKDPKIDQELLNFKISFDIWKYQHVKKFTTAEEFLKSPVWKNLDNKQNSHDFLYYRLKENFPNQRVVLFDDNNQVIKEDSCLSKNLPQDVLNLIEDINKYKREGFFTSGKFTVFYTGSTAVIEDYGELYTDILEEQTEEFLALMDDLLEQWQKLYVELEKIYSTREMNIHQNNVEDEFEKFLYEYLSHVGRNLRNFIKFLENSTEETYEEAWNKFSDHYEEEFEYVIYAIKRDWEELIKSIVPV